MTMIALNAIETLAHPQLDQATRVLYAAFHHYPLLRYAFAEQDERYDALLTTMFRLNLSRRMAYEGPVLGVYHGQALAGVAGVSLPDHGEMPAAMQAEAERFSTAMGATAHERFDAYSAIVEQHRPLQPHLYLGVLGVLPHLQGRGYGRALLNAVHALAEQHPTAQGVYLDTEHATNVALYAHVGYTLLGHAQVGPVEVWCMYRPNDALHAGT